MEQTKREVRLKALLLRDALSPVERTAYSQKIMEKIIQMDCYRSAAALLVYVNFQSEVQTEKLIEHALQNNKAVFTPAVLGREMEFYRIRSLAELKNGYHGILEPAQDAEDSYETWAGQSANVSAKTLLCMPGAAFDRERNRIGYGGGYYDRYLFALMAERGDQKRDIETLALAFFCQIFDEIPCEPHDLRPEKIVTEREIITDM